MKTPIVLKKFAVNLNSRALADSIFTATKSGEDLLIDFKGIETATPSFCHEMLVVLKKNKVSFTLANVDEKVKPQIRKAIGSLQGAST